MIRLLVKLALVGAALLILLFLAAAFYFRHQTRAYQKMPDTRDLKVRIDEMGAGYIKKRTNGALVVGLIQRDRRYVKGFGRANTRQNFSPDATTLFEIGSITKVFTAVALAQLANDGAVKLDDSIHLYLPKNVKLPSKNGREMTLQHLATHTAGLPRLPDNFNAAAGNEQNPYVNYKAADLYKDLSSVKLQNEPGKTSDYSNYGFGLLGHILELKSGKNYETLIKESVCEPLGMTNTTITLSPSQQENISPGHDPKGQTVSNWDFNVLAGCGAFRSNAGDLLRFLEANLHADTLEKYKALHETHKSHFKDFINNVGLGWQLDDSADHLTHWHNGGTGGYVSFIGFDKKNQVGIVILSNYGDVWAGDDSVDEMGFKILKLAPKISLE